MRIRCWIFAVPVLMPPFAVACSVQSGCSEYKVAMRRAFEVSIRHDGKPLRGATVDIVSQGNNGFRFSGVTGDDGTIFVTDLAPGNYQLTSSLLGVYAGSECFHVQQPFFRAGKSRLIYEWGGNPAETRRIFGRMVDVMPGKSGSPLWNHIHRVEVPIKEARISLSSPTSGRISETNTGADGTFSFNDLPNGIYVLHAEGGFSELPYDSSTKLIKLSSSSKINGFKLRRTPNGSDCGFTFLEPLTHPTD